MGIAPMVAAILPLSRSSRMVAQGLSTYSFSKPALLAMWFIRSMSNP
jgi:hypothetical protein